MLLDNRENAELEALLVENRRKAIETEKLRSETAKLKAETVKLKREGLFYPILVATASITTVGTFWLKI